MGLDKALGVAGAVGGLAKGIFGIFQGAKMLKEAKKINPFYKPYETSEAAKAIGGMAQTRLNAVNPSFGMQQRAISGSQANALATATRAVTDPSQLLAMAAGTQGASDEASARLGAQVDASREQGFQNWMQAQNILVGEDRMKYQDMMNKYQMDLEQKNALRSAGQQNIAGGIGAVAGAFTSAAGMGLGSGSQRTGSVQAPSSSGLASGIRAGFGSTNASSPASVFGHGIGFRPLIGNR